jgi:flagellar export protein FliJ
MAKFVFQLEGVLHHRENVERQRQRELALALAERAMVEDQIRRLDDKAKTAMADLRANHLIGKIDLLFLQSHRRFMMAVQRQGAMLVARLRGHQKLVDAAQAALSEAMKQKKLLTKLRERQQSRWAEGISRKEIADLDEVATQMSYENLLGREFIQ